MVSGYNMCIPSQLFSWVLAAVLSVIYDVGILILMSILNILILVIRLPHLFLL